MNLGYQLNPRWLVGAGASYEESEFLSVNRIDEFRSAVLSLTRSFGDRFAVFVAGEYVDRESTDPLFVFDDTRVTLGIVFQGGVQPTGARVRRGAASRLPPGSIR